VLHDELRMKNIFFSQNISRRGMLKIEFLDSKREIERSVKAIFLNVCKNICLKLGVVFKQSGDFSKADTGENIIFLLAGIMPAF